MLKIFIDKTTFAIGVQMHSCGHCGHISLELACFKVVYIFYYHYK